jgi:8-oxo-dGTP pyrophosphatase MutT (NUDIX family)
MYKVFIENKPIIFQFNSEENITETVEESWIKIITYLESTAKELIIEINKETDFWQIFKKHKFIVAAGGLVQSGSRFLFIKRNDVWDIPKGKLDPGESPEIAAVREIEEECGLIAPIITDQLLQTYHTYHHKGKDVLKLTHWYLLEEGSQKSNLKPQLEEGITEIIYLEPNEFSLVLENTYSSIKEVIEALKLKMN